MEEPEAPFTSSNAPITVATMTDHLPGAMYQMRVDADGAVSFPFIGRNFLDIHEIRGISPEEFVKDTTLTLRTVHPDDLPRITEKILHAIQTGQNLDIEWRIVTSVGTKWLSGISRPTPMEDGSTVFCGYVNDITERKAIDQRLAISEAALARQKATQAILLNMTHELRTPLNGVMGYVGLALDDLTEAGGQESVCDDLRSANKSARHLLSIIENLLTYSEIAAHGAQLQFDAVDICALIDDVVTSTSEEAKTTSTTVTIVPAANLDRFNTDREKLRVCLTSLVSNACKFTQNGLVEITWQRVTNSAGNAIEFSVIDNGPGIAPDQLAGLFQVFQQADSSLTKRTGGVGLGLAMCQQLARLMGGDVRLESTPGAGTTATLLIPEDPANVAA